MISVPESDLLMFVGSPRFTEIEDMSTHGVFFSDFSVHDASKDLVLLSHYQKGERELVEKLDEASNHLKVRSVIDRTRRFFDKRNRKKLIRWSKSVFN